MYSGTGVGEGVGVGVPEGVGERVGVGVSVGVGAAVLSVVVASEEEADVSETEGEAAGSEVSFLLQDTPKTEVMSMAAVRIAGRKLRFILHRPS